MASTAPAPASLWGRSPSPPAPRTGRSGASGHCPSGTEAAGTDAALRPSSRRRAFTACWSSRVGSGARAPGGVGLGLGLPQPPPRTGGPCSSAEGGKPRQRSPRSPVAPRRVQVMMKHQGCRVPSSVQTPCRRPTFRPVPPPAPLSSLLWLQEPGAAQRHLQLPRLSRPPAPIHSTELPSPSPPAQPHPQPRLCGSAGLEGCSRELGTSLVTDTGTLQRSTRPP